MVGKHFQYLAKQILGGGDSTLTHVLVVGIGIYLQAHNHFLTQ